MKPRKLQTRSNKSPTNASRRCSIVAMQTSPWNFPDAMCFIVFPSELSFAASKTRSWTHALKIPVGRVSERCNEIQEVVVGSWTFHIAFPLDRLSTMIPGFMGTVKHELAEAGGVETRWQVPWLNGEAPSCGNALVPEILFVKYVKDFATSTHLSITIIVYSIINSRNPQNILRMSGKWQNWILLIFNYSTTAASPATLAIWIIWSFNLSFTREQLKDLALYCLPPPVFASCCRCCVAAPAGGWR